MTSYYYLSERTELYQILEPYLSNLLSSNQWFQKLDAVVEYCNHYKENPASTTLSLNVPDLDINIKWNIYGLLNQLVDWKRISYIREAELKAFGGKGWKTSVILTVWQSGVDGFEMKPSFENIFVLGNWVTRYGDFTKRL